MKKKLDDEPGEAGMGAVLFLYLFYDRAPMAHHEREKIKKKKARPANSAG